MLDLIRLPGFSFQRMRVHMLFDWADCFPAHSESTGNSPAICCYAGSNGKIWIYRD